MVVLRPEALAPPDSDSETEPDGAPPSPCRVRFVNDNVLINGRSSMPCRPNKDRISKVTSILLFILLMANINIFPAYHRVTRGTTGPSMFREETVVYYGIQR